MREDSPAKREIRSVRKGPWNMARDTARNADTIGRPGPCPWQTHTPH